MEKAPPTSMDLFAGCGGMTLGLEAAGFSTILASDVWAPAVATFEANFGAIPMWSVDVREISGSDLIAKSSMGGAPDLLAGGPPCQGFSSAGARSANDRRNSLVGEFARLIAEVRPRAFLFENVEGFLTAHNGDYVLDLLDPLIECGYRIGVHKLNVANWGVPQLRKRVVAFGALGVDPPTMTPTHYARGAPGVGRAGNSTLPPTPSVTDAFLGLGSPDAAIPDHDAPVPSDDDRERYASLPPGGTMRDLPEHLQHASYRRRANRRVSDGTPSISRGGAPAGLRRLLADEPSKAITGAATQEFVHPTENRRLTLRECAKLQTFPDWFIFQGSKSDRRVQVGNAVPVLFAQRLGEAMQETLRAGNAVSVEKGRYSRLM